MLRPSLEGMSDLSVLDSALFPRTHPSTQCLLDTNLFVAHEENYLALSAEWSPFLHTPRLQSAARNAPGPPLLRRR